MILPDYIKESVDVYCESKGIPTRSGFINEKHRNDVEGFIQNKLKQDRAFTKTLEQEDSFKISNILKPMITGYNVDSPIEEFMFNAIKNSRLENHCRPQFQIGTKRVDFAFPIAKLVVECDGRQYHYTEKYQIENDQERDKYLSRKGWRVLHFEGLAIRRNIDLCMDKIIKNLSPYIKNDPNNPSN